MSTFHENMGTVATTTVQIISTSSLATQVFSNIDTDINKTTNMDSITNL